ncbi:MAG: JAB domain-containing protein, partial [Polyangiales bacterium]
VEHVLAIAVDARNRPVAWYRVSQGGTSSAGVEVSSVFRPAIVAGASGLVLVHNHPSGETTPSPEDTALTRRVVDGGELLGIRVLDHVIVGDDYFSFLDAGMLPRGSA